MVTFLKRTVLQRLFGRCATQPPADGGCWSYQSRRILVDLDRAVELRVPGAAIRLEGNDLPHRVLLVHGNDGTFHALENRCQHAGRRLDPVSGEHTIQCCSVGRATYDYEGKVVWGQVNGQVTTYPVVRENHHLVITLS